MYHTHKTLAAMCHSASQSWAWPHDDPRKDPGVEFRNSEVISKDWFSFVGRNEVDSLLKRRGRTLAARSGVLEDNKEDSWFEGLEDEYPKVSWMRRVYPRVHYTQAPRTVMLRQPSQSIYTLREA